MPRVPEVFRISDDDELALDEEIDARYLDDPADVDPWQEALLRRTAAETQGPLPTASAPAGPLELFLPDAMVRRHGDASAATVTTSQTRTRTVAGHACTAAPLRPTR